MSYQDPPKLEDFKNGYQPPRDPAKGKKITRIIIGVIGVIILALAVINFMGSEIGKGLAGKGTITGFAVDEAGSPIQVEVLVFGTNINVLSDENGYFEINNAPEGMQDVIVAYGLIATEVEVVVQPGAENNIGTVTVPTEEAKFLEEE